MRKLFSWMALALIGCGAPQQTGPVNPIDLSDTRRPNDKPVDLKGRIRILYLEGQPGPWYRALRSLLLEDSIVAGQVLLFDGSAPTVHATRGLEPLGRFPTDYTNFDVIVLGDWNPSAAENQRVVQAVRDEGKGLVMLSGIKNNPLAFAGTPLESMVPVEVQSVEKLPPAQPTPTAEGLTHPATRLGERNREMWSEVSPCTWYLSVRRVRAGTVLLEGKTKEGQSQGPLLVATTVGNGRVLFCATNEFYKWRSMIDQTPYDTALWHRFFAWAAKRS